MLDDGPAHQGLQQASGRSARFDRKLSRVHPRIGADEPAVERKQPRVSEQTPGSEFTRYRRERLSGLHVDDGGFGSERKRLRQPVPNVQRAGCNDEHGDRQQHEQRAPHRRHSSAVSTASRSRAVIAPGRKSFTPAMHPTGRMPRTEFVRKHSSARARSSSV